MVIATQINKSHVMTGTTDESIVPILAQSLDNERFRDTVITGKWSTIHTRPEHPEDAWHAAKARANLAGVY